MFIRTRTLIENEVNQKNYQVFVKTFREKKKFFQIIALIFVLYVFLIQSLF